MKNTLSFSLVTPHLLRGLALCGCRCRNKCGMTATILLICLSTFSAHASGEPLVYRRDSITIMPAGVYSVKVLTGDEDETKKSKKKTKVREPIAMDVEIRSVQALQSEWFYSASQAQADKAVMIMFDPPTDVPLMNMRIYEPLDVIYIDEEGKIIQIVPEVVLADLQEPIGAEHLVRSWLFLQGGSAERLDIRPKDRVEHPLFNPRPRVLQ